MSWLSDINDDLGIVDPFESSIKGAGFQAVPDSASQSSARKYLESLYKKKVDYPTLEVGEMSGAERTGLDILDKFLAAGESPDRAGALGYLSNMLQSPSSIMDLPEIKALMTTINNQTADLVNSTLRRTQIAGMGTSSPQGSAAGREVAKGQTSMVATLAPYLMQERSNKLTAAGMIGDLVTGAENTTMNKLGAASTFGALPREIENQKAAATYQKKVNDILAKFNLQAPAASQLLNETRYMYNPGVQQPSIMSQLMPGVGAGIGAAAVLCDERVKENFASIDNALEKLGKLVGKTYNYKSKKPGDRDAGIIAQDLEKVLPEGVAERDGVKYVKLEAVVALLVTAINELHETVKKKAG